MSHQPSATGSTHSPSRRRGATPSTGDHKIARLFGLEGQSWMRHANPASVWTRFTVLSLLSLAIWSRDWIGLWCLLGVGLAIIWMFVNPLFLKAPKSTRNWASRTVLGERIWVDRDKVELPEQFRSRAASLIANAYSTVGMGILVFGLVDLNVLATVTGILITHGGKAWYLDRVSLLFAEMKGRREYAAWDF
jgi:uncharacterized protein DUF6653